MSMKKNIIIFATLLLLISTNSVGAQSANWVGLQIHAENQTQYQTFAIAFSGALDVPINGAGIILNYDPACLQMSRYQSGTLLPNSVAFPKEEPGKLDIAYYYQGKSQALIGEGTLIEVYFNVLGSCSSLISADPAFINLGILDNTGMVVNLSGVTYRDLIISFPPPNAEDIPGNDAVYPPDTNPTPEKLIYPPQTDTTNNSPQTTSSNSSLYATLITLSALLGFGMVAASFRSLLIKPKTSHRKRRI